MRDGYESYYIKEQELEFLLAGKGKKQFYGFQSGNEDNETISKEKVFRILAALYQKQVIDWEDNCVVILEPWKQIIDILIGANYCFLVENDEQYICYWNNKNIIVVQQSWNDKGTLKITQYSIEDFMEFLWEKDFFPQEEVEWDEDEIALENMETLVKTIFTVKKVLDGKSVDNLSVLETGIRTELLWNSNGEYKKEYYTAVSCRKWLLDWINSGKKEMYDIS